MDIQAEDIQAEDGNCQCFYTLPFPSEESCPPVTHDSEMFSPAQLACLVQALNDPVEVSLKAASKMLGF